jgi:IPT/TIG domain
MRSFPLLLATVFAISLLSGGCGNASHTDPFKTSGNFTPPAIASLTPSTVPVNSVSFTMVINGNNFGADAVVFWHGTPRFTQFVNPTMLQVAVTQTDLDYAGLVPIYVRTQGLNSNTVNFDVAIQ